MIDFPEDYFKTEIRDGFEITSMMKRAWEIGRAHV